MIRVAARAVEYEAQSLGSYLSHSRPGGVALRRQTKLFRGSDRPKLMEKNPPEISFEVAGNSGRDIQTRCFKSTLTRNRFRHELLLFLIKEKNKISVFQKKRIIPKSDIN